MGADHAAHVRIIATVEVKSEAESGRIARVVHRPARHLEPRFAPAIVSILMANCSSAFHSWILIRMEPALRNRLTFGPIMLAPLFLLLSLHHMHLHRPAGH